MAEYILTNGIRISSEFTSETFGLLTTIGPKFLIPKKNGARIPYQVCLCRCGEIKVAATPQMKAGHTRSCGCLSIVKKTRNPSSWKPTPEQECLYSMRKRCFNKSHRSYANYGGRGIKVCDRWMGNEGLRNFIDDMGLRPVSGYSIDRIDNDGDYCPDNCRWASVLIQNRNRRSCNMITHNGETKNASEWAEEYSIPRLTLDRRLRCGWSIEKALQTPLRRRISKNG